MLRLTNQVGRFKKGRASSTPRPRGQINCRALIVENEATLVKRPMGCWLAFALATMVLHQFLVERRHYVFVDGLAVGAANDDITVAPVAEPPLDVALVQLSRRLGQTNHHVARLVLSILVLLVRARARHRWTLSKEKHLDLVQRHAFRRAVTELYDEPIAVTGQPRPEQRRQADKDDEAKRHHRHRAPSQERRRT